MIIGYLHPLGYRSLKSVYRILALEGFGVWGLVNFASQCSKFVGFAHEAVAIAQPEVELVLWMQSQNTRSP